MYCASSVSLAVQDWLDPRDGVVGAPVPSVEIRVSSCEEVKDREDKPYLETDKVHYDGSPCLGRGEVSHVKLSELTLIESVCARPNVPLTLTLTLTLRFS